MTPLYLYILVASISIPLLFTAFYLDVIKHWRNFFISTTLQTKELQLRAINLDGGGLYGADKIIGVIVRLSDAFGKEIGTYRSNDIPIKDISWQQVTQMPQGNPSGALRPEEKPRNN